MENANFPTIGIYSTDSCPNYFEDVSITFENCSFHDNAYFTATKLEMGVLIDIEELILKSCSHRKYYFNLLNSTVENNHMLDYIGYDGALIQAEQIHIYFDGSRFENNGIDPSNYHFPSYYTYYSVCKINSKKSWIYMWNSMFINNRAGYSISYLTEPEYLDIKNEEYKFNYVAFNLNGIINIISSKYLEGYVSLSSEANFGILMLLSSGTDYRWDFYYDIIAKQPRTTLLKSTISSIASMSISEIELTSTSNNYVEYCADKGYKMDYELDHEKYFDDKPLFYLKGGTISFNEAISISDVFLPNNTLFFSSDVTISITSSWNFMNSTFEKILDLENSEYTFDESLTITNSTIPFITAASSKITFANDVFIEITDIENFNGILNAFELNSSYLISDSQFMISQIENDETISEYKTVFEGQGSNLQFNHLEVDGVNIGGIFLVSSVVFLEYGVFKECYLSDKEDAIIDTIGGKFECMTCIIENNYSKFGFILRFVEDCEILFENSNIENNESLFPLLSGISGDISFVGCTFANNVASTMATTFFLALTKIKITSCTFQNEYTEDTWAVQEAGFILSQSYCTLEIEDSNFINGRGSNSGAISIYHSEFYFVRCTFMNNYGFEGTVYGSVISYAEINNCTFEDDTEPISNSHLQMAKVDELIISNDTLFSNTFTNSLILEGSKFRMEDTTITIGYGENGGCANLKFDEGLMENCFFSSCESYNGGAIYYEADYTNWDEDYSQELMFSIKSSTFENNWANYGGAIYVGSIYHAEIESCTFENNIATFDGGAILFKCGSLSCDLGMNSNSFTQNNAYEGGAVSYLIDHPTFSENQYYNNEASYGIEIASYPHHIDIYLGEVYQGTHYLFGDFENTHDYFDLIMGSCNTMENPLILQTMDIKNQLILTDFFTQATITRSDEDSDIIILDGTMSAISGIIDFELLTIKGVPGVYYDAEITLKFNWLETKIIDLISDYLVIPLLIYSRLCYSGEEYTSEPCCTACEVDTFLFEPPTEPTNCKECIPHMKCYGKNITTVEADYWRKTETTDFIVKCLNPDACLKGDEEHPTGICNERLGFSGILCSECIDGYSKTKFSCSKCPSAKTANIVIISLIGIGSFAFMAVMVKSTFAGAKQEKPIHSVLLRILVNHMFFVSLMSAFNLDWPDEIKEIFMKSGYISEASEQLISFDCLIEEKANLFANIVYIKLIIFGALPIVVVVGVILFFLIESLIHRSFAKMRKCALATVIIILFMYHPNIFLTGFAFFNCLEIDSGESHLLVDLSIECFSGDHLSYALILGLPVIFLWGFGIPLFALYLLFKNKKSILAGEEMAKYKYGFLFTGYTTKFYWEIIIMYRKMLLVGVSVFLSTMPAPFQAIICVLILLLALALQINMNPFGNKILNRMEAYSIMICIITLLGGSLVYNCKNNKYILLFLCKRKYYRLSQ